MDSTWSVNPLALVQSITGEALRGTRWEEVQPALEQFFQLKEEMIFERHFSGPPEGLQVFQNLANTVRDPILLADLMQLPVAQEMFARYGRTPAARIAIELALPLLVPVADAAIDSHAEIRDYILTDVSYLDPVQGGIRDCYLISAMIALAWSRPSEWSERVRSMVGERGPPPVYRYAFFGNPDALDKAFAVVPRLPADSHGRLAFARSAAQLDPQGEFAAANLVGLAEAWTPMLEKAFALWRRPRAPGAAPGVGPDDAALTDYHHISANPTPPEAACAALAGGVSGRAYPGTLSPPSEAVRARCDEPRGRRVTKVPTMAWTFENIQRMAGHTFTTTGLVDNHAYAVLGLMSRSTTEYVVLRNPWGLQPVRADGYAQGSWCPGAGPCGAPEVELNQHGVFAIRADWFNQCFATVSWVTQPETAPAA